MPTVNVKLKGANRLIKSWKAIPVVLKKEVSRAIKKSTLDLERIAVRKVPVDTANLRNRLEREISPMRGRIYATVDYAIYVHEGTRPHEILPKRKKFLAFKKNGRMVFAKKVRHPGTKANPFFEKTRDEAVPKIERHFKKALENAAKTLE